MLAFYRAKPSLIVNENVHGESIDQKPYTEIFEKSINKRKMIFICI